MGNRLFKERLIGFMWTEAVLFTQSELSIVSRVIFCGLHRMGKCVERMGFLRCITTAHRQT